MWLSSYVVKLDTCPHLRRSGSDVVILVTVLIWFLLKWKSYLEWWILQIRLVRFAIVLRICFLKGKIKMEIWTRVIRTFSTLIILQQSHCMKLNRCIIISMDNLTVCKFTNCIPHRPACIEDHLFPWLSMVMLKSLPELPQVVAVTIHAIRHDFIKSRNTRHKPRHREIADQFICIIKWNLQTCSTAPQLEIPAEVSFTSEMNFLLFKCLKQTVRIQVTDFVDVCV